MNRNAELPRTPESFTSNFEALFNTSDIDQLIEVFESDAVIHLQDGHQSRGTTEIRSVLAQFLSFKLPMRIVDGFCVTNGDYALVSAHWYIHGVAPDGSQIKLDGKNCDVIHRGHDGFWRHTVDNPFGTDATP